MCGKLGNLLNISEPPFTLPSNGHGYTQLKGLQEGSGLMYELGIACGTNPVWLHLYPDDLPPNLWSRASNNLVPKSEGTLGSHHEMDRKWTMTISELEVEKDIEINQVYSWLESRKDLII